MRDLTLPDRIRAKGVEVVLVPGWESRGSSTYNPRGAVNHHTAGSASGTTPSLGVVTYGRSDVPGPLCQVLQSREPSNWDKAYVVCSGRSNNAGTGGWNGLTGNTSVAGLEIEHVGTTTVHGDRLEVAARIQAALLEAPGSTRNAAYLCQHFEWTTRKIDFYNLAPHFNVATFRSRVAYWIGRSAGQEPAPITQRDDDQMWLAQRTSDGKLFICTGAKRFWVDTWANAKVLVADYKKSGGVVVHDGFDANGIPRAVQWNHASFGPFEPARSAYDQ
jgi:hypothetical protein